MNAYIRKSVQDLQAYAPGEQPQVERRTATVTKLY